jgi:D-alanyl-D-alanine dipeptidase
MCTLPRKFWDRVSIQENNEPMVSYESYGEIFLVRKTIAEKLDQVKNKLPQGVFLKILDGYRSLERQKQAWDNKWNVIKSENPNWTDEQIDAQARLIIARPSGITNHVCGGAVDVALVDSLGNTLDFGTGYGPVNAHNSERSKTPMFAGGLTQEQISNRKMLRHAMTSIGFVYYPGEWWHYCYGDRMWAVYGGRTECFYGSIKHNL